MSDFRDSCPLSNMGQRWTKLWQSKIRFATCGSDRLFVWSNERRRINMNGTIKLGGKPRRAELLKELDADVAALWNYIDCLDNEYKHKTNLAYLCNLYLHPFQVEYFSKPFRCRRSTTCANSFSCIPFLINRLRNLPSVSPSGTWLLESTPQNSENARLSMASATVASSERLYRFCSRYRRTISSRGYGLFPRSPL